MNQLQTINNLTIALQSARAIDATTKQLEYVLAQAMAKAFADMGLKAADRADEITYLVQTMPGEVVSHLPGIRLQEIPVAINRGILQQFGDFYGLNVATFMRFLTAHYQSTQRLELVKKHMAAAAIPARETPGPEQLQQIRLKRIATAFEQYQTQGFYNDYGNLVFDSINKMGKIPFTAKQEMELWQRARQNLIDRYSRVSLYPDERATLRATLAQITQGEANNLITAEAKRITLFELFDWLMEKGTEISEWMSER